MLKGGHRHRRVPPFSGAARYLGRNDGTPAYAAVVARTAVTKRKCSFCGKHEDMVAKLIAGPGVSICVECIDLCVEILEEEGFRDYRSRG